MPNKKASTNRDKHRVTIILVGVPRAVRHVISVLHVVGLAKAGDWLVVKQTPDRSELTMTIVIDFMW